MIIWLWINIFFLWYKVHIGPCGEGKDESIAIYGRYMARLLKPPYVDSQFSSRNEGVRKFIK